MPDEAGPGVRPPPPLVVAGLLALAWVMQRLLPVPLGPPLPGVGMLLVFLALAWGGWALLVMAKAGNNPRPDRPDTAFVAKGPFRWGRNPMYLGFTVLAAGIALSWGHLWGWLAVGAIFLWLEFGAVRKEERCLERRFPASYPGYKARVRRWL